MDKEFHHINLWVEITYPFLNFNVENEITYPLPNFDTEAEGMDKWFLPTLYRALLIHAGIKLIHVSKRDHWT